MDAAEISGKLGTAYQFRSYRQFWFPEWDICKPDWRDEDGTPMQFDIILSDQVWEHLDYPWRATRNVYNMLREGGWFYVCVPFYLKYHGAPHDCTRWTARGLHFLLEDCGFDSARITTGQWGNRECALADMGRGWAVYDGQKNSLENDPNFPVVSWAWAQK